MKGTFRLSGPASLEADACIVGSGAGGASVADVLTAAGLDVVMLEEGPNVPAEAADGTGGEAIPRLWRGAGLTAALGVPPIAYAEGAAVGGSTEINSAIFQRVADDMLDGWAREFELAEFGAAALRPYYDRAAAAVNASLTPGPLEPPSRILAEAGERLGWKVSALERGQRFCAGTNMCSFRCPTGGKQSMSETLLPAATSRGMRLLAGARVERLLRRGRSIVAAVGRATGPDGRTHAFRVRAKRFFVAAGAVHTPALLQRSLVSRRAGATFKLHPTIKCVALFDEARDFHKFRLPLTAITEFMPDQRIGGSVMTPALLAMGLAEDWTRRGHLMERWRQCGSFYGMIRPKGQGRVLALPGLAEPLVFFRLAPDDWRALAEIGARLGEAMFAAGAREVWPSVTGAGPWRSVGEARALADGDLPQARTNLMTIHIFGSCRPGARPDASAVDGFGRVWGTDNLVVADASLIPDAPGCNPQGTVMALAFRAAEAALAMSDREGRARALGEAA
ncbi:MAG: GMC family oxidoreductase [Alphaproteobacteria bacterium]|nr:GMC family oxidoreductase [Alphaproteobacteria bacterium]